MSKKRDLIALASIPLIMTLGNSMLLPVLPLVSHHLGITSFQVSLLITVYGVVAILMIPIAGFLSDRYGRKKIIVPSLLITAIGGAVAAVAAWLMTGLSAYWVILAGRFLQGIGAAGAFPIVLPFVGDLFHDEKEVSKGLGLIETSNTFGKVLSPILGALLGAVLWYLPFISIPALSMISFLMVIFMVRSPKRDESAKPSLRQFLTQVRKVLGRKGRWLYAIFAIGGICMFVIFGVLFFLSETLEETYGMHGAMKGLVLAVPLALLCLASYGTGKIIGQNKRLMKWVGFFGMLLLTGAMVVCIVTDSIYWLLAWLCLAGIGIGITLPSMDALITEGIEKSSRGTITSLYSSMRFIGVSLGPPVVSLLMSAGQGLLFITMTAVGAAGGLLTLFAVRPKSNSPQPSAPQQARGLQAIRRKAPY